MSREAMKRIKTWYERCEEHPDHQHGMVNKSMIQARMQEEIDELRQALDTEQEPVAWMHNFIEGNVITHIPADIGRHPERWTPLYTAPPKHDYVIDCPRCGHCCAEREWVGLTDDEVSDVIDDVLEGGGWLDVSRALEAAIKRKNT